MNSWTLPLLIPVEFLTENNYSTKHDHPNFSAALLKNDWLPPGPDATSTLHVVTVDIGTHWRACQRWRGQRRQVTNKKLIDSDDTMLALRLVLWALRVALKRQHALGDNGHYVDNLWAKSALCCLFISRDTGYPPSVFWRRKPLLLIIVRQPAY